RKLSVCVRLGRENQKEGVQLHSSRLYPFAKRNDRACNHLDLYRPIDFVCPTHWPASRQSGTVAEKHRSSGSPQGGDQPVGGRLEHFIFSSDTQPHIQIFLKRLGKSRARHGRHPCLFDQQLVQFRSVGKSVWYPGPYIKARARRVSAKSGAIQSIHQYLALACEIISEPVIITRIGQEHPRKGVLQRRRAADIEHIAGREDFAHKFAWSVTESQPPA